MSDKDRSRPLWSIETTDNYFGGGDSRLLISCSVLTRFRGTVRYSGTLMSTAGAEEIADLVKDLEARALQLAASEAPLAIQSDKNESET